MTILGIDPGTNVTGYALLDFQGIPLDFGCIRPPRTSAAEQKRQVIFEALTTLIDQYQPLELAIELQYVRANVRTAIMLGMVRGIAVLAGTLAGLSIHEYEPSRVKKAVCTGQASKAQVQEMVTRLLHLKEKPPEDAADALAICICHQRRSHFQNDSTSDRVPQKPDTI